MDQLRRECPLNSDPPECDWQFLYTSQGIYKGISIYECKTCGLQSQYPRQNQTNLYDADYYKGKAEYTYIDERETETFHRYVWNARLDNIQKYISSGKLLDVGSSFGGFLKSAKEKGFAVQGVEISSYASKHANENEIPTFQGSLLDAHFPDASFDVITLVEVIEHLENPKIIFSELGRILKPGGLLLLQTANFEGWQAKEEREKYHYYMPGHVYYYSDSVLKKILTPLGFNRFICYFGVDFSLLSKLRKSRGNFKHWYDYRHWFRISYYHFKSKLSKAGFPLTSSYVLYAFKSR
ncbi:class I SAM-dependent methyltransferase [Leptospira ognonensis]|uniref:Class I SAM-dependent methyltransferase n=1 Tax=Leptospira ognonensis TaxID=2484945 RepID=A0A4R9KA68_9LEPT|nr:class I SAM-dependent methyltransferase [Leptospira ognonensis]TGL62704.1 class I SAM-dependent methyltransferase [Leptospira ognonensis]